MESISQYYIYDKEKDLYFSGKKFTKKQFVRMYKSKGWAINAYNRFSEFYRFQYYTNSKQNPPIGASTRDLGKYLNELRNNATNMLKNIVIVEIKYQIIERNHIKGISVLNETNLQPFDSEEIYALS